MKRGILALALFAAGCGRYADFELPAPPQAPEVRYRWEVRAGPVLPHGGPGEFDSSDALNPVVVADHGSLLNLYSGFDGKTWHTGAARSDDGLSWTRLGKILSPDPGTWEGGYIAANGAAIAEGGRILYWYQAGDPPRIGLAQSSDGRSWSKHPQAVIETGPVGSWDERGVADPFVLMSGGRFYLFYTGMDRARRQRLGVAQSADGIRWTKLRANPVLEIGSDGTFDENGLGEPAVWMAGGRYWMLYTGRDRRENRRIGAAVSRDGVHWERSGSIPVLEGHEPWDAKVVCDPTVLPGAGGRIRIWFGGGDQARPDERLNGAIGYAELVPE